MKRTLAIALIAVLASGCAAQLHRSKGDTVLTKYEGYVGAPVRSITALTTQSWQPVNRDQLILWTSMNDAYLITVTGGCQDLQFVNKIGVTTTASSISTLDHVRAGRDNCLIKTIQPIDVRQMKADERLARAEAKTEAQ